MIKNVWVRKPSEEQKKILETCPVWDHEAAEWICSKEDDEESFLVTEGRAYVELRDGTRHRFTVGDLVTFPAHEAGDWKWVVEEHIKKHYTYNFI